MAQTFFPLDDKARRHLVVNVAWERSNGWTIADLAQEHKARAYVRLKSDKSEIVGLTTMLPKGSVFSLAALCAEHAKQGDGNAAYLLQLTPDTCALICVLDGLPVSDYDRCGVFQDLLARLGKFQHDAMMDLTIFSNIADCPDAQSLSLPNLLGLLDDKQLASTVRVRPAPKNLLLPIVAVATVLLFGGYYLYQWWDGQQTAEQNRRNAAAKKPPQQIYEESLPAAFAKAGWSLADTNAVLSRIGTLPVERGGWKVEKIACSVTAGGCVFTWVKHLASATFETFVSATAGGAKGLGLTPDKITETVPVTTTPFKMIPVAALQPTTRLLTGAVSELQRLAGTGDAQLSLREPLPFATTDAGIRAVMQGGMTLAGELYLLPMALSISGGHLSVANIELAMASKPTFRVDINYYASKP